MLDSKYCELSALFGTALSGFPQFLDIQCTLAVCVTSIHFDYSLYCNEYIKLLRSCYISLRMRDLRISTFSIRKQISVHDFCFKPFVFFQR